MDTRKAIISVQQWREFAEVDGVLARCLDDLGGITQFVRPGQMVVIKPNITANAPAQSGGTTYPELVEAIIRQVRRCQPGRIVVAEGTGRFGTTHQTAFPSGGWREMAARTGVELFNLDAGPHEEISLENPRYPHPMPFSKLVLDADVYITVPCLKTHISADYTVALKNAYALTPQWKRSEIHAQYLLEQALTDLNRIRKPDLCVVDGWDGAEGIAGGTDFKRPAGARLMLAGADAVAVDVISREIMCLMLPTRYLTWAIEDGVGVGDPARIEVRGDGLEACRHRFMSPAEELCLFLPQLTVRDQAACSGCRIPSLGTMGRFRYNKLLKPVTLVFGGEGETPVVQGEVLVLGDCAQCYAELGTYIPGCPPRGEAILTALEAHGCVCLKCRDLVSPMLAGLDSEFLSHLRVTATGSQVFSGEQVKRHEWHLELLVGNCMRRYAEAIRERAPQFGLDAERDLVWLDACPPTQEAIRQALVHLQRALATAPR